MSHEEENRRVVVDMYRNFELGNMEVCRELVSPDCTSYIGGNVLDLQSWIGFGQMFMTAFPDGRHVWELAVGAGDYVLLNGYFTGTHQAPFMGVPASGKKVKFSATIVDKVVAGKIAEHRGDFDTAALMQQIGGGEPANRALVERLLAAVDAQDWTTALSLVSPTCRARIGANDTDRQGWMELGKGFYVGFPDGRHSIDEVVTAGDRVIVFGTWSGTHRGEFQGLAPSGRRVSFSFIQTYRIAGGAIVQHRGELDGIGLMQQLTETPAAPARRERDGGAVSRAAP